MADYILVSNKYRNSFKDVRVTPGEKIVSQNCLLLIGMVVKVKRKGKCRKKLRVWMVRESEGKETFAEGVNNKCANVMAMRINVVQEGRY